MEIREAFLHYFATIMGNYRFVCRNGGSLWGEEELHVYVLGGGIGGGGRGNYILVCGNWVEIIVAIYSNCYQEVYPPSRKCLRPLLSAPSDRSHDITLLFDQQLFLKHCPSAESAFFSYFFDTQIFTSFIEHTENTTLAFCVQIRYVTMATSTSTCTYIHTHTHTHTLNLLPFSVASGRTECSCSVVGCSVSC